MEKRVRNRRLRIGKIGEVLLLAAGATGLLSMAVVAPNAIGFFNPLLKKQFKHTKAREVKRNVDSLVRSGIFEVSKDARGHSVLRLTVRGKWEYTLRHRSLEGKSNPTWDKKWRVLVFDISNDKTGLRNELRRAMRLFGFRMIQKSVWVYPHKCDDFISLLRSHLGVSSDVLYMTADMIENDKELRREFDL